MKILKIMFGLALCILGVAVQRRANGEKQLYTYLFGGNLWLAGVVVMLS